MQENMKPIQMLAVDEFSTLDCALFFKLMLTVALGKDGKLEDDWVTEFQRMLPLFVMLGGIFFLFMNFYEFL